MRLIFKVKKITEKMRFGQNHKVCVNIARSSATTPSRLVSNSCGGSKIDVATRIA